MNKGWTFTILILVSAVGLSAFLWSIGIYFFFLPVIFLPFLRFVRFKESPKTKICPVCGLSSDGNYCSRCGARLN